ncbi:MAG: NUDIX domain-containing protein [Alphaproteobacteria bacterium]|nr:NUDIX domain-containing protein [Alphaproteobacteria bacterium]
MTNIGVGIGVYLLNEKNELLIGLRKSKHGNGTWSPPGGKLEFSESFEACGIREAKEECNLDLKEKDLKILGVTSDVHENEGKHFVTIHLFSRKFSGELNLNEPDKFEQWKWTSLDDLPENLFLPALKFIKENKQLLKEKL